MQRSGSTYIYNLLQSHPDICLSPLQEIHYYSQFFDKGIEWYSDAFPGNGIQIDTSPKYFMQGKSVAPRIKECVGQENPQFLLILRNPIDYVHSHFRMHLHGGYFKKHPELFPKVPTTLNECFEKYPSYFERGLFAATLQSYWLPHFSREQFLILPFKKFIKHQNDTLKEIQEFFGLTARNLTAKQWTKNKQLRCKPLYSIQHFVARHEKLKNTLLKQRWIMWIHSHLLSVNTPKLEDEMRIVLKNYYADDVRKLKDEIGFDTSYWKDFS